MIFWDVLLHSQRHFDSFRLWFMPVSLKYPTLGKKPLKTTKKKTNISRLFGRGGSQPRLSENCFFVCFICPSFFCFCHFQPFAVFCTLAVLCFHAVKLAGTTRLTTATMNILGLRIKTARSNFEMFDHVLDNNLSFMLYFLKKYVA